MAQNNKPNQNQESESKNLLLPIYGKDTFVKIYQALDIGKIKFSFVNKEKPKEPIDCYINADDFASDLIDLIDSGELRKRASYAKQEQQKTNAQYAKDIWESRAGVSQANENVIRKFTIQPGSTQDFVFRATQGKKNIVVGFAYRELKLLSYRWHFLEKDWNAIMEAKYNMKNMTSEYHQRQNAEQYAKQMEEERMATSNITQQSQQNAYETSSQMNDTPNYGVSSSPKNNAKSTHTPSPNNNTSQSTQASMISGTEQKAAKVISINLKVKTPLVDMNNGGKAFQGWGADNKEYNVIIRKDVLAKANAELQKLMTGASTLGSKVTVKGAVTDDNRIYVA